MNDQYNENSNYTGLVSVIMPLDPKYNKIYTNVIKSTFESKGYICVRIDVEKSASIYKDIVKAVLNSDFIIADITDSDPTVMYELGRWQTLDKVTIMISQNNKTLQFDTSNYRIIKYEKSFNGKEKLKVKLGRLISNEEAKHERKDVSYVVDPPLNVLLCLHSLCMSMESMKEGKADDEVIELIRAIPTELGESISSHFQIYNRYEKLIKEYIERPDLVAVTIFGCPPNIISLKETLSRIKASYFPYPENELSTTKESTAFAFHPYLSGYSLFLLGTKKIWEDKPGNYQAGFVFLLDENGIPVFGIKLTDEEVLLRLKKKISDEIEHEKDGVKLKTFDAYVINANNHVEYFRKLLAESMISIFNKKNGTNIELVTSDDSDIIELISK